MKNRVVLLSVVFGIFLFAWGGSASGGPVEVQGLKTIDGSLFFQNDFDFSVWPNSTTGLNDLVLTGGSLYTNQMLTPDYSVIVFGDNHCPNRGQLCLIDSVLKDKLDVQLGDGDEDRVTFGTSDVRYSTAKTRYWSIIGAGFHPYDESTTYTKGNGVLLATTGIFNAAVNLPHGAVITKMTVNYYDNSAANYNITLFRTDMKEGFEIMATVSTSGASPTYATGSDESVALSTIDNSAYAYYLLVLMSDTANHKLGGVVIEYTVTEPLP